MRDPVAFEFEELGQTHDGLAIDCPDCMGAHLVARYLKYGCPKYEDPQRSVLLLPEGDR